MRIRILYFQNVRKATGTKEESIELEDGANMGDLLGYLVKIYPDLEALAPSLLFAVNETHARKSDLLRDGDTVALMPPFSGG